MHLFDLAALYAALGVITTLYIGWRQGVRGFKRLGEMLMTALFWPFVIALTLGAQATPASGLAQADPAERALNEAFEAVRGSPLENLLPESAVSRLRQETQRSRMRLTVEQSEDSKNLCVKVRDQGPGIAAEHLGKVFQRFFTTDASGEGTGLGLAIVASVAASHQGSVRVHSEPMRGTEFTFCLPLPAVKTKASA